MDSFALHLAGVVAGVPCIRFRCLHVQVEAQIMPLLSSRPASHSMAGKRSPNQAPEKQVRHVDVEGESANRHRRSGNWPDFARLSLGGKD
jgi:hypothetical protein